MFDLWSGGIVGGDRGRRLASEIADLGGMAAWLAEAGQASLHTLPLLERAAHERSPYSALSAFAIDPIHLGVDRLEDFVASGGRGALSEDDRGTIARLR